MFITTERRIILGNASFHKSGRLREIVRREGCELKYLPKYSPDMNKIEMQWYGIKQRVKRRRRVDRNEWMKRFPRCINPSRCGYTSSSRTIA
ncbi:MAG: transposase [Gloeomargaritaceae cyanobacterium C42_A2020_066]|nr:transposase [Gloeomargaritaceae cyanobacterium C42_A2020_066]